MEATRRSTGCLTAKPSRMPSQYRGLIRALGAAAAIAIPLEQQAAMLGRGRGQEEQTALGF
jgi:hypothetical protein